MITLYFALLLIIPEAVYEGTRTKHPRLSFAVEFFYRFALVVILMAVAGGFCFNGTQDYFLFHVFGYVLVRFATFDILYAICSDQPLLSLGSTKIYDTIIAKVPWHLLLFMRGIALFMGIVWLLK
jgi:hypothetical protein